MSILIHRECDWCGQKQYCHNLNGTHYTVCDSCQIKAKSSPFLHSYAKELEEMARSHLEMMKIFSGVEGEEENTEIED